LVSIGFPIQGKTNWISLSWGYEKLSQNNFILFDKAGEIKKKEKAN
jgi:hypothetical protein